jgi:Glycosyl hydrolase family 1
LLPHLRVQPDGRGAANPEGVAFYNRLIDCLVAHGIKPLVTLYHWVRRTISRLGVPLLHSLHVEVAHLH